MEYCSGGSLSDVILRHEAAKEYIGEAYIWFMFFKLTGVLQYLHYGSNGPQSKQDCKCILHCDIKPDNVLVVPDFSNSVGVRLKLADFGYAQMFGAASCSYTRAHYKGFWPREAPAWSTRSDVYQLATVFYGIVVLDRQPPSIEKDQVYGLPKGYSDELAVAI